ncbi:MAG: hypothetical protein OHK93_005981 [Ramalina farinacea]|uniref:Uncharacterized protein n=1 Tax=Ramalina farinacea TaxID=258253 RepID=A0AA43TU16_9LECA|nr:hypothetical protein [Ramalina farinacea]
MPKRWDYDLDAQDANALSMQFGGVEDQMALAADMGYQAGMPYEQPYTNRRYGYDGNDSEPDTMPPPYTEHDPKPPKSLPQMQTSRRGPLKQAAKRGSYAYLGGGPALSTYRPNMAQSLDTNVKKAIFPHEAIFSTFQHRDHVRVRSEISQEEMLTMPHIRPRY